MTVVDSNVNALKVQKVLALIDANDAEFSDDTYLEKFISECGKALKSMRSGDHYITWGVKSFITKHLLQFSSENEETSRLEEFALKLMLATGDTDASTVLISRQICEHLVKSEKIRVKFIRSTAFLQILKMLNVVETVSWSVSQDLWKTVVLAAWELRIRESRSIFWKRSLDELSGELLSQLICHLDKNDLNQLLQEVLSLADRESDFLSSVLPSALEKLLNAKKSREVSGYLKSLEILYSRENSENLEVLLTAVCFEGESFEVRMKAIFDANANSRLALIKNLQKIKETHREDVRKLLRFILAQAVCKSSAESMDKTKVNEICVFLKHASGLFILDAYLSQDLQEALEKITCNLLMSDADTTELEDKIVNKLAMAVLVSYENLISAGSMTQLLPSWNLLSIIATSNAIQDNSKVKALKVLQKLLNSKSISQHSLGHLFQNLWKILLRCHWGTQDSFLELLSQGFDVCKINQDDFNVQYVRNLIWTSLDDNNPYIRASALQCLTAMLKHPLMWENFDAFSIEVILQKHLVAESEGVARRKVVLFVIKFYEIHGFTTIPSNVLSTMTSAVLDFDRETRENVVSFWERMSNEIIIAHDIEKTLKLMEDFDVTTALSMAMLDCELKYFQGLLSLLKRLQEFLGIDVSDQRRKKIKPSHDDPSHSISCKETNGGKKDKNNHADDDIIEEIIQASDKLLLDSVKTYSARETDWNHHSGKVSASDFVIQLKHFDVESFESHSTEITEMQGGFDAIMNDILESVQDRNAIDGIDCV